jgi:hypothetical protein
MDMSTFYVLKEKYEKELIVAQAKIDVINDIIEATAQTEAKTEIVEFDPHPTQYSDTDNVM